MDLWTLLTDIVILLAGSLLLGGLFSRFGQSPLVGYLVAGMFLGGPGSLHAVRSEQEIEAIAELGVALLLFSLGLEFSLPRLRRLGGGPLSGGALQAVLTVLLGAGCAMLCGMSWREAVALGMMIAPSSTAVVLRILMERGELEMPHGRNSLAVLLVQDMSVVPLALGMTLLAGGGGPREVLFQIGGLVLMAAGLVMALLAVNLIAVRTLGTLTLHRNRELSVIFAVMIGLGSAAAAHAVGMSPALGAFVAGMFLGSSAFATQIRADVSSLRIVLLTLFFGAAGMVADAIWIVRHWYLVAGVVALVTCGKTIVTWGVFRGLGQSTRVAAATGLCLGQIGEFAFVLGSIGRASGVVTEELYALIVSVTIVSFVLSAWLVPSAPRFGNVVASWWGESSPPILSDQDSDRSPEVVIIGFGPAGQIAARPLMDQGRRVVVLDLNREGIRRAQQLGYEGQIGDATQPDVLEHAGVMQAKAVIITVPHRGSALTILKLVLQCAPQAHVAVRSRYQLDTEDFRVAGAHVVVGDEEQVGEGLANRLVDWLATDQQSATSDDAWTDPDDSPRRRRDTENP